MSRFDFDTAEPTPFRVLMLHDLSFVDRRQRTARDFVLVFVGISILLLALLIVLVAWLQLRRWVGGADRRHPRQALSRRRQVAALLHAHPVAGTASAGGGRGDSSGWRSIFARTGRRRRCSRWCASICDSRPGDHRVESRALHPQFRCRRQPGGAGAGQRHGDGARAHHARLLGRLGGARQRHGGPRGGGSHTIRSGCRRTIRPIPCAACGSPRNRSRAITTASPMRGCGRCATWPMCGRRFAPATGAPTRK